MITFYENNPQNHMRYNQRKPDELSFLSDDEDEASLGFNKNKRMSQITATDSAYYSESSNQATTLISPKMSTSPSPHHNVIIWQKQQQQYQKQNESIPSPSSTPTPSFENGNDMASVSQMDAVPQIDNWDSRSTENYSEKSPVNRMKYSPKGPQELSYNSPEQRTQRIQLRMSQWKEKLELMSNSSAVSSSSSVVGYSANSGRSSPNPNFNNGYKRGRNVRHASFSSTIDGIDSPFSSARSIYSMNSLPNSVFDEKYDSFAEDDRESVFSIRSSTFHQNYTPRSKSSLEVRSPSRNSSRLYGAGFTSSPLKESRLHIMQAELESSQRTYKQKLQQVHQMKQDLEQYQYKLEEVREKEIEQARKETIEELENTVIKNLKLEIEALQNKLQETTRELEHSKAYSDMLRNELITLKMNEQSFTDDKVDNDEEEESEETKVESPVITVKEIKSEVTTDRVESQHNAELPLQSSELQRLAMLERELKKKNEEIIELKKKLDKSTKLNELSKREIDLLNRKVENHRQAREDIEKRHTKLVDVASANEIELNKLRHKLDMLTQRQDKALKKMKRRYSSILEVDEEEEEEEQEQQQQEVKEIKIEEKIEEETINKVEDLNHEKEESSTSNEVLSNNNNISNEASSTFEPSSLLDDTINDILDLSDLNKDSLSDTSNVNSDNLDDLLNQLNLSDLDDDDENFNLDDISFDDETLMV